MWGLGFHNCWKNWRTEGSAAQRLVPGHGMQSPASCYENICQGKCSLYLSPYSTSQSTECISLGELKHYLEPRWQRTLGNVVPCLPAPKSKGDSRSSLE